MNNIYKIVKLDHFGRGIIRINDKVGFVNDALVDDEVEISIIEEKKNYCICDVKKYVKKSNKRREFCKYSSICGGCDICDLDYNEQLKYKEERLHNIFEKYIKEDVKINDIIHSNDSNYRNKITLHVKNNELGLYKKNSNELVSIDNCMLVNPLINNVITMLKDFIKGKDINSIVIKCTNLNEIMIVFNGNISEKEVNQFLDCKSIYINDKCIKEEFINEKIGEYTFSLSKDSFFQVNKFNTVNLYNEVLKNVKDKGYNKVLDLYCGTGTIGIYISKYVNNVVGIEQVKDAVVSANINKDKNNIENISFICGKVEDNIDKFKDIDLIITDPPRSGMDKKTIASILKINPKSIVYVSCDAMTLVRDLNLLKEKYNIIDITPVDMFPNTYHCESITVLERK